MFCCSCDCDDDNGMTLQQAEPAAFVMTSEETEYEPWKRDFLEKIAQQHRNSAKEPLRDAASPRSHDLDQEMLQEAVLSFSLTQDSQWNAPVRHEEECTSEPLLATVFINGDTKLEVSGLTKLQAVQIDRFSRASSQEEQPRESKAAGQRQEPESCPDGTPERLERENTWSAQAERAALQGSLRRQEAEKAAASEQRQLEQQRPLESPGRSSPGGQQRREVPTAQAEPAKAPPAQASPAPAAQAMRGDKEESEVGSAASGETSSEEEENTPRGAGILSGIRKRASELGERLPIWKQSGAENSFFFYAKGAFMSQEAPDGQSWADHCSPVAPGFASDKTLIGRWADCMRAAVVLENAAPKWKDDPAYSGTSPTEQVVQYFEACGHSDHVGALQNAMKAYRSALQKEVDDGISSSRCSSRSIPDSVSVVSTNPCE